MSIGMGKTREWRARHLEVFQDAVVHENHALCRYTFVVKLVVAQQVLVTQLLHGGVVNDAEEFREDGFAYFFREGLALIDVLLAMALGAMSENFVEEDGGSAAREQRRPHCRIVQGRGH